MYLLYVSVEGTFLAEDVRTVRTNNALHIVFLPHVDCEVRNLLVTLWTRKVLEAGHMDLQSVDVERGLGGELLVTVRAFLQLLS